VAALGSIAMPMSVADRSAFWDKVEPRLARLGNKLGKDGHAKLLTELAAKIPVPTEAEREAGEDEFAEAVAALVRAGWSAADIVHAIRMTELDENEMQEVVSETVSIFQRAQTVAIDRAIRRRRAAT